ncbi:MAG: hypothetical protein H7Z42_00375 [Roseiflexaceae bacterium]|nr:hypothetical protein [Roseiflexaceae bacterium]
MIRFRSQRWVLVRICWFVLVVATAGVGVQLVSLRPLEYVLPPEDKLDIWAEGITTEERGDGKIFRWFHTYTYLDLQGLSAADHRLTLLVHERAAAPRQLRVALDNTMLLDSTLRPGWQLLHVLVPASAIDAGGLGRIEIIVPALEPGNILGVAVARFEIAQLTHGHLTSGLLLNMVSCAALFALMLLISALPLREASLLAALGIGLLVGALGLWRVPTAVALPMLARTLLIACGCALVCRLALLRIWDAQQPWLGRTVALVAILFTLHAAGMQVFRFIDIDHIARANHVLAIAQGNQAGVQAVLSNQYEWGITVVPYSLWSYYLLLPLTAWFQHSGTLTVALKIVVSLIHATTPLLLYALVQLTSGAPRAGYYAALVFAALPLTHLYHHDGSYPTIIGIWFVALALLAFTQLGRQIPSPTIWRWYTLAIFVVAAAMLMYVTHALFLPCMLAAAGAFAALRERNLHALLLRRSVIVCVAAAGLSLLLYYGQFIAPMLMAAVARLQETERPGHSGVLPAALVGPFWLQVWGHTRVLPLLLAAWGLIVLLRRGEHTGAALGIGCLALLGIGAVVDVYFNLWNKHWYFLLPALALYAGHGCADLGARAGFNWPRILPAALAVLCVASAWAWMSRVFLYQWSLWSI